MCPERQSSEASVVLDYSAALLPQIAVLHQYKKRVLSSGFYQWIDVVCRLGLRPYGRWLVF